MKDLYSIYSIVVILWYIVSLFMMLYIYNTCIRRYKSKNEKKIYEEKPKKISSAELSYLMYKAINYNSLKYSPMSKVLYT